MVHPLSNHFTGVVAPRAFDISGHFDYTSSLGHQMAPGIPFACAA